MEMYEIYTNYKVFWEIFGYIATAIVASSFLMKSFVRLRFVNLTGGILCVIYSLLIKAYPVVVLNGFISCANIYFLWQYYKQKEYFRLVPLERDDTLLTEFLKFYKSDIEIYFPDFQFTLSNTVKCFYILRNMVPAGVFIFKQDCKSAEIILDYVTSEYRDTKTGKFIFNQNSQYFLNMGIERFFIISPSEKSFKYLDTIGFVKKDAIYEKNLI